MYVCICGCLSHFLGASIRCTLSSDCVCTYVYAGVWVISLVKAPLWPCQLISPRFACAYVPHICMMQHACRELLQRLEAKDATLTKIDFSVGSWWLRYGFCVFFAACLFVTCVFWLLVSYVSQPLAECVLDSRCITYTYIYIHTYIYIYIYTIYIYIYIYIYIHIYMHT